MNQTLSDMQPLQDRLAAVGAPPDLLAEWFAGVLRDGFALTAAGGFADFTDIATQTLRGLLEALPDYSGDPEQDALHVVKGFNSLPVHRDVPEGVRRLHDHGYRLITMTNGTASSTEQLLNRAGLRDRFDALLDVQGPRCWKPGRAAYDYAVARSGVEARDALLVAVHPWDVDGAVRAGLTAAWLGRGAATYPAHMRRPTFVAQDVGELAAQLAGG